MTTTTFFTGSAPSASPLGKRAAPASFNKAVAPARSQPAVRVPGAYPWMTQALLSRMSVRARRLMRADY